MSYKQPLAIDSIPCEESAHGLLEQSVGGAVVSGIRVAFVSLVCLYPLELSVCED